MTYIDTERGLRRGRPDLKKLRGHTERQAQTHTAKLMLPDGLSRSLESKCCKGLA